MSADWIPPGHPAFVPRCRGFGARLLGLDAVNVRADGQQLIRVTRHERDLLGPDLTLVGADPSVLIDAVHTPSPGHWARLELRDRAAAPALDAVLNAAQALAPEGPVGVLLPGPVTLANRLCPEFASRPPDAAWEELVDACVITLCDVAGAVLDAGGHIVIEEQLAPGPDALDLYSPLWNLLRHRRRPPLVVLLDGDPAGFPSGDAVLAVAHGADVARWDAATVAPSAASGVASPEICADASPEEMLGLVKKVRGLRPTCVGGSHH